MMTIRTYVRYRRGMRCPIHGRQEPEDEEQPVCPVGTRRTIAGVVDVGSCGMPLGVRRPKTERGAPGSDEARRPQPKPGPSNRRLHQIVRLRPRDLYLPLANMAITHS